MVSLKTGPDFFNFVKGSWKVDRTLRYNKGGLTGTFTGLAKFRPILPDSKITHNPPVNELSLLYTEEGVFAARESHQSLKAYRHYLFRCDDFPVQVYFVLNNEPLQVGRFFHDLDFVFARENAVESGRGAEEGVLQASFEHLCVKDVYSGKFRVLGTDGFEWNWNIVGPNKDGTISTKYEKFLDGE